MKCVWLLVIALLPFASYADEAQSFPFEKYPAAKIYRGKPAPARPVSKRAHQFRTVIREGARQGPNFAGHYTVVTWGCGSSCFQMAILDAITGQVYDVPFSVMTFPLSVAEPLHYRIRSRLLVLEGCSEEKDEDCATRYYEWNGKKLVLLQTAPLTQETEKK